MDKHHRVPLIKDWWGVSAAWHPGSIIVIASQDHRKETLPWRFCNISPTPWHVIRGERRFGDLVSATWKTAIRNSSTLKEPAWFWRVPLNFALQSNFEYFCFCLCLSCFPVLVEQYKLVNSLCLDDAIFFSYYYAFYV
jgi:hypothetical protein